MDREWSALLNAATRSWHMSPGRWQWDLVMRDLGTSPGAGPAERLGVGRSPVALESRAGGGGGDRRNRGLSCSSGAQGAPPGWPGPDALTCLQCPGGTFTPSMKSTKDYPDEVINFMRSHPLMYQAVYPLQRRPLVVRTGAPYRLTTVAVDQVDAADGRYEVLFLGTGTHCCSRLLLRWARWVEGADPRGWDLRC